MHAPRQHGSVSGRRRVAIAIAVALATAASARAALAQPALAPPPDRLVDVDGAGLPPGVLLFRAGHRGELSARAEIGFGGDAALGLGIDDRIVIGDDDRSARHHSVPVGSFRIALAADRLFRGQPAVDLGLVRTIGSATDPAFAELHVAGSHAITGEWGRLWITAGVALWDVRSEGAQPLDRLAERIRPYGGLSLTVARTPRTSLLLEGTTAPTVIAGAIALSPRIGWGVRYQAMSWGAIDLLVRHRLETDLTGATVMVRLATTLR